MSARMMRALPFPPRPVHLAMVEWIRQRAWFDYDELCKRDGGTQPPLSLSNRAERVGIWLVEHPPRYISAGTSARLKKT